MQRSVVVIGLGRFGTAVALECMRLGHEVLAVDRDEQRVNDLASEVTHALQLDATDEQALRQAGAGELDVAVVAITDEAEPSIFATMALKRLGVGEVVATAGTPLHAEILERVGADRVVYPEREMGQRVAHILGVPDVVDYLDIAPRFGIVRARAPRPFVGRTLAELDLQRRLGLSLVAIRRGERVTISPPPDERIAEGDDLILIGRDDRLDAIDDVAPDGNRS